MDGQAGRRAVGGDKKAVQRGREEEKGRGGLEDLH